LKAAVTLRFEFMVTVHVVAVPEQAPDQPAKVEPVPGVAVRVTDVPALKVVPVGLLVTVPLPAPLFETLNVYVTAAKLALMVWLADTLVKGYELTAPTEAPSTFTSALA
jgi:hypothetical protein